MNDLKEIYNKLLEFGENHNMVNQALFLMHENELEHIDIEFRCIVFIISSSNLSRELNSPSYTIDFEVMVMDKVDRWDNMRNFESVQENIFVLGQLQDYMQQNNMDVDMDEIDLINESSDDYNINSAASSLSFTLSRPCYNKDIDIDIQISKAYYEDKIKVYYADSLENAEIERSNNQSQSGGVVPNMSDLLSGNYKMYMYSDVDVDLIYNMWCEGDDNFAMYMPEPYHKTVSLSANTMKEVELLNQDDFFPILLGLQDDNETSMLMAFTRLQDVSDITEFFNFGAAVEDNGYSRGASWTRRPEERIGIWISSPINDDI